MRLTDPVTTIHHIGAAIAQRLRRLNIETVGDLLYYLPRTYEDLSRVTPISKLTPDTLCTVRGRILSLTERKSFRRRLAITKAEIEDVSGVAALTWFGNRYIAKTLTVGSEIYIAGKPKQELLGFSFQNPDFELVKAEQLHTARIIPLYSLTEGISQKQIRFLMHEALTQIGSLNDPLPKSIRDKENLPPLTESLSAVHFPNDAPSLAAAIERLKFDELFWRQLKTGYAHRLMRELPSPAIPADDKQVAAFIQSLPFTLTNDQIQAVGALLHDITLPQPTHRLIQGDVGSGKTVIVATAIYTAARAGIQTAIMAPTEVLALQHYQTLSALFAQQNVSLGLLTSKHAILNKEKSTSSAVRESLKTGACSCIVGTHALIQESVSFSNLGLAVIDEQHRFGVRERRRLMEMNASREIPHLVSLTATPIPRTLALTMYGDLEISAIRHKPVGRKPIITRVVAEANREKAYGFIAARIARGEQVFFICPLIDESDAIEAKSVLAEYERLRRDIFPRHEIRFLHGKIPSPEKKKILEDFKDKQFPILISTTVIEVGIDIPNATVMVIEGAERFGLAQLHQIRGRVGRSDLQSYCLLFTGSSRPETIQRLSLLAKHQDGFILAEEDLKMRGEGEVFGARQSGLADFSIATIHDTDIITRSRAWVDTILSPQGLALYREVAPRLEEMERVHFE